MKEIWKTIEGKNGYEISSCGRIRSVDRTIDKKNQHGSYSLILRGKLMKLNNKKNKYVHIGLGGNKKTTHSVHRLVATAFIDNIDDKCCINHIDNNPSNNHVSNLEWVTHRENTQHAIRQGRMKDNSSNLLFKKKRAFEGRKRQVHRKMLHNFNVGQQQGDLLIISFEGIEHNRTSSSAHRTRPFYTVKCLRCKNIFTHISIKDGQRRCKSCAMRKSALKRFYLKKNS